MTLEEEVERVSESEGKEDTRRARSSESTEQSSYRLIETEAASTGPAWARTAPGPLYRYHSFQHRIFVGLLSM